jgi:hypothetical protein
MQNKLSGLIGRVTGWDKNPASVFYMAIPLAALAFGCEIEVAIMKRSIFMESECVVALVILAIALIPAYRSWKILKRMNSTTPE